MYPTTELLFCTNLDTSPVLYCIHWVWTFNLEFHFGIKKIKLQRTIFSRINQVVSTKFAIVVKKVIFTGLWADTWWQKPQFRLFAPIVLPGCYSRICIESFTVQKQPWSCSHSWSDDLQVRTPLALPLIIALFGSWPETQLSSRLISLDMTVRSIWHRSWWLLFSQVWNWKSQKQTW